jgi:cytochrome c peroxidase
MTLDPGPQARYRKAASSALACILCLAAAAVSTAPARADADLAQFKAAYRRPTEIPFPESNPYTPEKAALGKSLFFDPRLSGNQNMNCASCHNPSFGWEVSLKSAVGSQNTLLARKSPTVLNLAWGGPHFFWDGRADSLEQQAKGPIENSEEMNLPLQYAVSRLQRIPAYSQWFNIAFPQDGITGDTIVAAIATYERTVVSGYAPFDAWIDGNDTAISQSAQRGFVLFTGKASCATCHSGWNFSDGKFHDTGIATSDIGRAKFDPDNPTAMYAFKTPGLRDVGQRAPYMHDGSAPTLEAVIAGYIKTGTDTRTRSAGFRLVELDVEECRDVIEFLKSLTGAKQIVSLPVLPN